MDLEIIITRVSLVAQMVKNLPTSPWSHFVSSIVEQSGGTPHPKQRCCVQSTEDSNTGVPGFKAHLPLLLDLN